MKKINRHSFTEVLSETIDDYPGDNRDIVIVGNGIAGITAALEMCRLAPEKHVAIVTEQSHPTIYTPALKQFAIGKVTREQLLAHPQGTERSHRIHMIKGRVEAIASNQNRIYLSTGESIGYSSLLLATGSSAVGLAPTLPGVDFDGVLSLHRLNDYLNLRRLLHEVKEVVVVGGGMHAVETVKALLHRRIRVHWLIRSETFLPHMFDREASDLVLNDCRHLGVDVQTCSEIAGIVGNVGVVAGVVTTDDQFVPCQLVIACTGSQPVTTLASSCDVPLEHHNGFLIDSHLHTNVENIFAAGDCASVENPETGVFKPRMQWHAAVLQGKIAAAAMSGELDAMPSMGVPWHATQVGAVPMLSVGEPLSASQGVTFLTNKNKKRYRRLAFYDNQLVGYLSLGDTQVDNFAIKRLIDEGHSIRGIEKELLMGDFDAPRYFMQHGLKAVQVARPQQVVSAALAVPVIPAIHSRAQTEKLPSLQALQPSLPSKRLHNTEPLLPALEVSKREEIADELFAQVEYSDIKDSLSETVARKDKRELYTHAREIARLTQNERTVLLDEIEDTFGGAFPLQKFIRLLDREREQFERSMQIATVTRSVKTLLSGQPVPPRWLINDVLPEGLYLLTDTQKIGMSWFNFALGLSVSGSAMALGSNIRIRHGNVLYLALEDNVFQLHERMEQFLPSGTVLADDFEYATTWPRLHTGGLDSLEEWLQSHSRARMIIIDSWKLIKPSMNGKNAESARAAYYEALVGLKYLADTYNISILLFPHAARTAFSKSYDEPYGVAGAATCADGFLTLKQGKDERNVLLQAVWKPYSKDVMQIAEFRRDTLVSSKEIDRTLHIKQQPRLVLAQ